MVGFGSKHWHVGYSEDFGLKLEYQLLLVGWVASSLGRKKTRFVPRSLIWSVLSSPQSLPFPLPLGESHLAYWGWVKNQGVCKHPLNKNTCAFWANAPKWCCKPLLVVASKKQVSESRGPSYTRAVCWKSGCAAVSSRLRGSRGDGRFLLATLYGTSLLCLCSCLKILGSSESIFIRTSNVSVLLLIWRATLI